MFQVSGDARINDVGLVEGLRWTRAKRKEKSSDHQTEEWPLNVNASNKEACARRGGLAVPMGSFSFFFRASQDVGSIQCWENTSVSAPPSNTHSCCCLSPATYDSNFVVKYGKVSFWGEERTLGLVCSDGRRQYRCDAAVGVEGSKARTKAFFCARPCHGSSASPATLWPASSASTSISRSKKADWA